MRRNGSSMGAAALILAAAATGLTGCPAPAAETYRSLAIISHAPLGSRAAYTEIYPDDGGAPPERTLRLSTGIAGALAYWLGECGRFDVAAEGDAIALYPVDLGDQSGSSGFVVVGLAAGTGLIRGTDGCGEALTIEVEVEN